MVDPLQIAVGKVLIESYITDYEGSKHLSIKFGDTADSKDVSANFLIALDPKYYPTEAPKEVKKAKK